MRKIWVNKAESFDAAECFETNYYKSLSALERLETVQFLRETYFRTSGIVFGENGKRLRRVLSAVKQIWGEVMHNRRFCPGFSWFSEGYRRYLLLDSADNFKCEKSSQRNSKLWFWPTRCIWKRRFVGQYHSTRISAGPNWFNKWPCRINSRRNMGESSGR